MRNANDEEIFDICSVVVVYHHRLPAVPVGVGCACSVGGGCGVVGDS